MSNQQDAAKASELNNRGYELAEAGRWQEAIPYYQEALRHDPRHFHSLTNMGNALQALGRLSEALSYQDQALALEPENALAWANKAVILSGLNRRPEAIRCYERSLASDPLNKMTWFNKGVALFRLGNPSDAIRCLDHILENIDSRMKNALGAKAEILKAQGRTGEAAACMERMREIDAEGEPFSFGPTPVRITLFGTEVDPRKFLRGFEAAIRKRTGLPQITVDMTPPESIFAAGSVDYSIERGYRVHLPPVTLASEPGAVENEIIALIQNHAREKGVRPVPPPIPRTEVSVQRDLNFDTRANDYDALAHDGGYLLVFYRENHSHRAVLLRHVPAIGFVRYCFRSKYDYQELKRDAAAHCSAFLDLSYLDGQDMTEDTLRMFLREHGLYGWGSEEL